MSDIMDWFNHLKEKIEGWFEKLTPDIKKAVHWGVVATDLLKKFEDSGGGDFVAKLLENFKVLGSIPTQINDKIIEVLPELMIKLKLADTCLDLTDSGEILKCAIAAFQSVDPDFKKDFSDALATRLTMAASDGDMTWDEAKLAVKFYYDHRYKKRA